MKWLERIHGCLGFIMIGLAIVMLIICAAGVIRVAIAWD